MVTYKMVILHYIIMMVLDSFRFNNNQNLLFLEFHCVTLCLLVLGPCGLFFILLIYKDLSKYHSEAIWISIHLNIFIF